MRACGPRLFDGLDRQVLAPPGGKAALQAEDLAETLRAQRLAALPDCAPLSQYTSSGRPLYLARRAAPPAMSCGVTFRALMM
jgi:hypothetical protein